MNHKLAYHLHVSGNVIQYPLPGHTTLFLAKTNANRRPGFCAVFGPTATCLPEKPGDTCELFDAKVALFDEFGVLISLHDIHHGHKYGLGGGWVEIDKHDSERTVVWAGAPESGIRSRFMGDTIRPEDVLVAL